MNFPEDAVELSAKEVAEILGIGKSTLFKLYHEGRISGRRTCNQTKRSPLAFMRHDLTEYYYWQLHIRKDLAVKQARHKIRELRGM